MMISNMSGIWSNGRNRTFRGSDPEDYNDKVLVNDNTPWTIEGNGNCMITGDADALSIARLLEMGSDEHKTGTRKQWLAARLRLLEAEKGAHTPR